MSNSNTLPTYISINIDRSSDARGVQEAEEVIQRDAMLEFFRHVSRSVVKARVYRDFLIGHDLDDRPREHDTITISGGRGAGKTTFILSMFNLLRDPDQLQRISTAQGFRSDDVESLGILDPTLIEEKEHVFIHLLAKIKQKVDRAYQYGSDQREARKRRLDDCTHNTVYYGGEAGPCDYRSISDECYRDWLNLLKCLAAGLPSLDGVGDGKSHNSDKWHDPVYVMEKGLMITSASNDLEINYHRFIDKSLKLLNRTAFIIAFDDIDTHFKRGWPVLEVLRKYLTSPQLITVLSGDLDLYSLLIRGQQWDNFEKALLDREKENRQAHFLHEVDKLEQQYLLKLLKSERKLELRSLYYIFEESRASSHKSNCSLELKITSDNQEALPALASEVFDKIVELLFKVIGLDKMLYRDHLTREVIRTVIRMITVYERSRKDSQKDSDESLLNSMLDVLLDVYSVPLQQHNFNTHFLRDPDPRIALNQLAVKLACNGLLENGYRLKADFLDAVQNQLMMALGAVYNKLLARYPRLFFDYFIKVGLTRELTILAESKDKVEQYLNWSGLRNGENGVTISRQFTGFVRQQTNMQRNPMYRGTIALIRPRSKKSNFIIGHNKLINNRFGFTFTDNKPFKTFKSKFGEKHPLSGFIKAVDSVQMKADYDKQERVYFFNTVEELENLITSWHWRLVNLGLKRAIGRANDSMAYWSFHSLLAVIGEISECYDSTQIRSSLLRSSQVRDFPLPHFASGTLDNVRFDSMEDDIENADEKDQSIPHQIIEKLNAWNRSRKMGLPVHVVAKIFARYFYSLGRVDGDLAASERYFGNIIHRYIVIFLNAVLVEEAIYRSVEISLSNPTGSDMAFTTKLRAISTEQLKSMEFFTYIAACPLWGYFLDLSSPLSQLLKERFPDSFCEDKVTYLKDIHFDNLHELLNASLVRNVKDEENDEEEPVKVGAVTGTASKKKRFNLEELGKMLKKESVDVRVLLEPMVSDPFMMTNLFINQFLKPRYSGVSTKPEGRQFKSIQRELLKFMVEK